MAIKENDMRAFCSIVTVFSMENIGAFLREKLDGYYDERDCDVFEARLVLKKENNCLPDISKYFKSNTKIDKLINVEFLIASKPDGCKAKKEYALCVATYGINEYSSKEEKGKKEDPMVAAATSLKNRVWSTSCRSDKDHETILSAIIKFLLSNLDSEFDGGSSDVNINGESKLSIIVPDSKCCKSKKLKKKLEDNYSLFTTGDEGVSFAFVYFSAARGENGDDIRKEGKKELQEDVFSAIEQSVSADGGKNHAACEYRRILYDVATFSQPTGASLIKMGFEYNPYGDKEYGKILAWNYYEKYYIKFSDALLKRIDVYLKMKELREANDQKNVSSNVGDKVRTFMGQIEELDEECHAVIKTSASGVAAIWLDDTNTESIVISKARKECTIFRDNVREKEEQKKEEEQKKKEEDKDKTDTLFSIFTVLALVSCVWDGYCLFKELTVIALLLFCFSFLTVAVVFKIVLKGYFGIIRSYIRKNWWTVALFVVFSFLIFFVYKLGGIPLAEGANQAVENKTEVIQNIDIQNVSKQIIESQTEDIRTDVNRFEIYVSDTESTESPKSAITED